jgi:hypothetical protein
METNLSYFRQFYLTFPVGRGSEIRSALRSELTWTHYKYLIHVENEKARDYYLKEEADQNWGTEKKLSRLER